MVTISANCHRAFSFCLDYPTSSEDDPTQQITERVLTTIASFSALQELHVDGMDQEMIPDLELSLKNTGVKFPGVKTLHVGFMGTVQGLVEAFPDVENLYLSNAETDMTHVRVWSQHEKLKHIELWPYQSIQDYFVDPYGWTVLTLTSQSITHTLE